jgi:hypothetical protein
MATMVAKGSVTPGLPTLWQPWWVGTPSLEPAHDRTVGRVHCRQRSVGGARPELVRYHLFWGPWDVRLSWMHVAVLRLKRLLTYISPWAARITVRKGFSVVVWWGALSKEEKKLDRWKAIRRRRREFNQRSLEVSQHYRVPSLRAGDQRGMCVPL